MRSSTLIWATSLLTAVSNAYPTAEQLKEVFTVPEGNRTLLDEAFSPEAIDRLMSRDDPVIYTTGVQGQGIHTRYEIRDIANNHPKWWALLILAMQEFQNMDPSNVVSYWQIAAIHGGTTKTWNNYNPCPSCISQSYGYCTHSIFLFPAWHRAYLALFEQQLVKVAQDVAKRSTGNDRAAWIDAANTLRLPFWDWAANPPNGQHVVPDAISQPSVTIQGPSGRTTVSNPLYRYKMGKLSDVPYGDFNVWQYTTRHPDNNGNANEGAFVSTLDGAQRQKKDQVYNMLTSCNNYLEISNDHTGSSERSCYTSLEGIHDDIHTAVGGQNKNGHMTVLPLGAFDPVFWLHHANVDRLLALWQTIHPGGYGQGSFPAPHATWTITQGSWQQHDSPLDPFRYSGNNAWTTDLTKDWKNRFQYTYPEYTFSDGSRDAIMRFVNDLYSPQGSATAGTLKRRAAPEADSAVSVAAAVATGSPAINNPTHYSNGSQVQYYANVDYPRYALNGSYTIFVFNGEPQHEDPSTWSIDPNLITFIGALSAPGMNHPNVISHRQVALTSHLTDKHNERQLTDLHIPSVSSYLEKNLNVRIQAPDGSNLSADKLPGFQFGVFATSMTPVTNPTVIPTWSEFFALPNVTHGKCGGASPLSSLFNIGDKLRDIL